MLNLVTDRTLSDVERWRELRNKGWSRMTPLERQEWLGEITPVPSATRGMYTHNDLNRVERAVEAIVARFVNAGCILSGIETKTDWTYRDKPKREDMERYYRNISKLRDSVSVYADTPKAPTIDTLLDYKVANNIEKILVDVDSILTNTAKSWHYAGEIISGEV